MNKYKIVWCDGCINKLLCGNGRWKLEGSRITFRSLDSLENYYKGKISTFERVKNETC